MRILYLALLALSTVGSTMALAQPANQGPWVITVQGGAAFQSEADLDNESGSFSTDRWFASAGVDYLWNFRTALGVTLGTGSSQYDFKNITGLSAGDPWDDIEDDRISVVSRFAINEKVSGIVIPSLRVNRESGASRSDAQTWGLLAGVSWKISDTLTIGPALGVFDRLEESTRVFPILFIDWDITERWNLSTGRGLAASQGPGLSLNYEATDDWSVGISGRYEQIDFRLNNEGPAPGGVGRDEVFPLVLTADWQPNPGMGFSLFAGGEFGGTLELADSSGNTVAESDYDTSLVFGASFRLRF